MRGSANTVRLITIPMSHYREKARCGLERPGIDYYEERHLLFITLTGVGQEAVYPVGNFPVYDYSYSNLMLSLKLP